MEVAELKKLVRALILLNVLLVALVIGSILASPIVASAQTKQKYTDVTWARFSVLEEDNKMHTDLVKKGYEPFAAANQNNAGNPVVFYRK